MKTQELIDLAQTAEARVLRWIDEGRVPPDPGFGVCDILALLRDRLRDLERPGEGLEQRQKERPGSSDSK